eukprot:jgi/Botrbrau1/6241/Bobra.0109s0035.1
MHRVRRFFPPQVLNKTSLDVFPVQSMPPPWHHKTLGQVLHAHMKAVLCRLFVQRTLHNVAFMQISRIGTMPWHSFLSLLVLSLGVPPHTPGRESPLKKWAILTLSKGQMYMVPFANLLVMGHSRPPNFDNGTTGALLGTSKLQLVGGIPLGAFPTSL